MHVSRVSLVYACFKRRARAVKETLDDAAVVPTIATQVVADTKSDDEKEGLVEDAPLPRSGASAPETAVPAAVAKVDTTTATSQMSGDKPDAKPKATAKTLPPRKKTPEVCPETIELCQQSGHRLVRGRNSYAR